IVCEMMKTAIENGQNLIVEGCYIPPDWRRDFDEGYLSHIRFICLAMSDEYIDAHFDEIRAHSSDIERRLDDSTCTRDSLKEDNRRFIEAFTRCGERVTVIRSDYEKETAALLGVC
ncbi:MAG: adenylate kinase, partial [Coriobacteriia bacterium]|nr:adenylate kinase [Coriobacteriia bacterium]